MEDWIATAKGLPWGELVAPLIAAAALLLSVTMGARYKASEARHTLAEARAKEERQRSLELEKAEQEADAAQSVDFTARFRALMDAYEHRARDMTDENTALKSEVRDYKQRFESHQRLCAGCPHYQERIK